MRISSWPMAPVEMAAIEPAFLRALFEMSNEYDDRPGGIDKYIIRFDTGAVPAQGRSRSSE
jgi:hypothetical protein